MSKDLVNVPAARSWRDIPQPVKPRAMSRGGKWRLAWASVRMLVVMAFCAVLTWGGWMVASALRESSRAKPGTARAVPVKAPVLESDGVLNGNREWVARILRLRTGASLMELDLVQLQDRLLADGQVLTASVSRHFPDRLVVAITERTPIARVMTEFAGKRQPLLVARDGMVFLGEGYEPALLESLPWLDGVTITRQGSRFLPVAQMPLASELLGKARLEAEHLYRQWHVVSLARLESDREIEVRTRGAQPMTIVFNAGRDLMLQLAKLDYLTDALGGRPAQHVRIDLTLGKQVPISVVALPAPTEDSPARAVTQPVVGSPMFSIFPPLQSKTQREL